MTEKRPCKTCGRTIPQGRINALPNCVECVNCVDDSDMPVGIMVFSHKTAPELVIVNKEQAAKLNRDDRRGYKKKGNKVWED